MKNPVWLRFIILSLLIYFLILYFVGMETFLLLIKQAKISYLFIAFTLVQTSFILRALRWRILLERLGINIGISRAWRYIMIGWLSSCIIPARGGDMVRVQALKQGKKISFRKGLTTIFAERAIDITMIITLTIMSGYIAHEMRGFQSSWWMMISLFLSLLLFIVVTHFLPNYETKASGWVKDSLIHKIISLFFSMITQTSKIFQPTPALLTVLVLTGIIWLSEAISVYLILQGLQVTISLADALLLAFLVILAAAIPFIPGAMGQAEAAYFILFGYLGIPPVQSGGIILVIRLVKYWSLVCFSGVVAALTVNKVVFERFIKQGFKWGSRIE